MNDTFHAGSSPDATAPTAAPPAPSGRVGPGTGIARVLAGIALCGPALWLALNLHTPPAIKGVIGFGTIAVAVLALVVVAWALRDGLWRRPAVPSDSPASWRRPLAGAAVVVLALAAIGTPTYWLGRGLVEHSLNQLLVEVATLERSRVQAWIEGEKSDILVWTTESEFNQLLAGMRGSSAADGHASQLPLLRRIAKSRGYAALTLRDGLTGEIRLTTRDEPDSPADRQRAVATASMTDGVERRVHIQVDAYQRQDVPIQMHLFQKASNPDGTGKTIVQVDIDVVDELFRHIKRGPAADSAAQVLLVQRDGDSFVVLSDSLVDLPPPTLQHWVVDTKGSPWPMASAQREGGSMRATDDQGRTALAYAMPMADTPWLMVAKVEEAQMLGELNRIFLLAATLASALLTVGAWWWATQRRQSAARSLAQREHVEHAVRVAELSRRVVSVQEEERRRLAMELHDRTAANLAAIQLNLKCVARTVPASGADEQELLQETGDLLADTIVSIREFCADLRPPLLDYAGLAAAVRASAAQFQRRTGIVVEVEDHEFTARCPREVEAALFRVMQESFVNCAKHSGASTVRVRLGLESGKLVLEVSDDGCGFDADRVGQDGRRPGHGLLNMQDRAAFAGGTVRIDSRPGAGTRIRVEVPCGAGNDKRALDAPSR